MKMRPTVDKTRSIPVNLLGTMGFCEKQVYLEWVLKITARPTREMLQGTQAHKQLNGLLFMVTDTRSLILEALTGDKQTQKRNVRVTGNILRGSIDEIHIGPNEITIIDDKPWNNIHQSYINQVFGYCLAFKEQYKPKQPIFGAVRNHRTGREIWRESFSASNEGAINTLVKRLQGIIRGEIRPVATKAPEVCSHCRFSYRCDAKTR